MLLADPDALPEKQGEVREGWETDYGLVMRMNDELLMECFFTTTPDRATIEANKSKVHERCERGTGVYAFVFGEDKAVTALIYFAGSSGD